MKKCIKSFAIALMITVCCGFAFVGCGSNCDKYLKLEDYQSTQNGYTISNSGVTFKCDGENAYVLGGTVEKAPDAAITEFKFSENETHIVSLKLSANNTVDKEEFSIEVKGPNKTNTYGNEALDGDDYTFLLLAVDGMTESKGYSITVKWNKNDTGTTYIITKDSNLSLK